MEHNTHNTKESVITLQGFLRAVHGKSAARKIRRSQFIPANLLNEGQSQPVSVPTKWLEKIWISGGQFRLEIKETSQTYAVKIHEVQLHPVKRVPVHLDLIVVK